MPHQREKELNCLYNIEEVLNNWVQHADIEVEGKIEGGISVYYTEEIPQEFEGPFLEQERKLLDNIADRIGKHIFHIHSKQIMNEWDAAKEELSQKEKSEWQVIIDLLRRTDQELFLYVARKMTYYLCWNGVTDAQELLHNLDTNRNLDPLESLKDNNKPSPKISLDMVNVASKTFEIAAQHLNDRDILLRVRRWIQESRTNFLVQSLATQHTSLTEIADAIRRFHHIMPDPSDLAPSTQKTVNVSLIRRFFTDQIQYIKVAKEFISVNDMYELLKRVIFPIRSRGWLGGKSAGLFLASQIIRYVKHEYEGLQDIKVPKTWYITSDGLLHFMYSNNLEEIVEQKYKPIEQVRVEYAHTIQTFKNSPFPTEIIKGLSMALDDLGDVPLIVRSSSLLEDRFGTAFSGKYKSLFLANQGTKQERLAALTDAIAEVYASTFGPDPIEYRAERDLIDFHEEMGIMIQQVVGTKIGHYFLPSYAGVAFSHNEFRWSPRINRQDGLIRLVPGLGTRAVDRLADDYPVLIAPGQPNLQVNVTIEENIRYAPTKVDVINLKTHTFETIELTRLIKEYGEQIPALNNIVSILKDQHLSKPSLLTDFSTEEVVVTFDGLRTDTRFVEQTHTILKVLEEKMHTPVDIEFASDGKNLYLLQCRPQSASHRHEVAPIPKDIPQERIIFSAQKYVSNGYVPDITHLVYVDPVAYSELPTHSDLLAVGRTVSKLNKLLPKRQFILMGPGRWGSRGDIKLGVNVTYSDINNTTALIEIAMKKGSYVPELSFGTHFFQDLVEASIRYLPLYPDSDGVMFNSRFFKNTPNILSEILPEYASLSSTVRVLDLPKTAHGQILRLVMNADLDEALAYLDSPKTEAKKEAQHETYVERPSEDFWRWRLRMATYIASQTDPERFGVKAFYLIGSVKNATAGPASDIDLLIHFYGTGAQKKALQMWLEGWSLCLDEINYLKTGYRTDGLLDVHLVTDEHLVNKTSFAVKIGAVTDAARELPMKNQG